MDQHVVDLSSGCVRTKHPLVVLALDDQVTFVGSHPVPDALQLRSGQNPSRVISLPVNRVDTDRWRACVAGIELILQSGADQWIVEALHDGTEDAGYRDAAVNTDAVRTQSFGIFQFISSHRMNVALAAMLPAAVIAVIALTGCVAGWAWFSPNVRALFGALLWPGLFAIVLHRRAKRSINCWRVGAIGSTLCSLVAIIGAVGLNQATVSVEVGLNDLWFVPLLGTVGSSRLLTVDEVVQHASAMNARGFGIRSEREGYPCEYRRPNRLHLLEDKPWVVECLNLSAMDDLQRQHNFGSVGTRRPIPTDLLDLSTLKCGLDSRESP